MGKHGFQYSGNPIRQGKNIPTAAKVVSTDRHNLNRVNTDIVVGISYTLLHDTPNPSNINSDMCNDPRISFAHPFPHTCANRMDAAICCATKKQAITRKMEASLLPTP